MITSILSIFVFIDSIIYLLIAWMYGLVYSATAVTFISDSVINQFIKGIYTFVGIVVLFFVAYSVIRYIISPDNFSDKKAGFGSLTTRIFVAILLTILIPVGFDLGFEVQKAVLNDNIIGRIIYGEKTAVSIKNGSTGAMIKTAKDNEKKYNLKAVQNYLGASGKPTFGTGLNPGQSDGAVFAKMLWSSFIVTKDKKIDQKALQAYIMSDKVALLDIPGIILPTSFLSTIPLIGDIYFAATLKVSYVYIIATLAGGWALWMLSQMFFDIIMRIIKLLVLEILSPFFVAGYILDPSVLTSWWKKVLSSYLILFIRIFIFQLTMFLIGLLFTNFKIDSSMKIGWFSTFIIFITIIIALLYFAKIGPDYIAEAFGKKLEASDAKGAGKWMKDTASAAVGAVVGVAAAVATGGASLAATGAAMGTAAGAGGLSGGIQFLKTAAAGGARSLSAGSAAFKSGKSTRSFGQALGAGAESLDKAYTGKGVGKQWEGVVESAEGTKAKAKQAREKAVKDEQTQFEQIFTDSQNSTAYPDHALAGMSSSQQRAIMDDKSISDIVRAIREAKGMESAKTSEIVKLPEFKEAFDKNIDEKRNSRNTAIQEEATVRFKMDDFKAQLDVKRTLEEKLQQEISVVSNELKNEGLSGEDRERFVSRQTELQGKLDEVKTEINNIPNEIGKMALEAEGHRAKKDTLEEELKKLGVDSL